MLINELKNKIIDKTYPNVMLWVGPEAYVKKYYLQQMSSEWSRLSDYKSLNFGSDSLFKNMRRYFLIDGDSLNNVPEKELPALKNKWLTSGNVIVFNFVDKGIDAESGEKEKSVISSEVLKYFKDYIVRFDHLNIRFLIKHFAYSGLSAENIKQIASFNNSDYLKMESEINKIIHYAKSENITTDIAFIELLKQGIIIKPIGDVIFDFSGALLSGRLDKINYWYRQLVLSGEPVHSVTALLYDNFKLLYMIIDLTQNKKLSDEDIAKKLGISKGRVWMLKQNIATKINPYTHKPTEYAYSLAELERNMRVVQFVESGSKMGEIDEKYAMDYLLINLVG